MKRNRKTVSPHPSTASSNGGKDRSIGKLLLTLFTDATAEAALIVCLIGCVLTNFLLFDPLVIAEKWLFVYALAVYFLLAAMVRSALGQPLRLIELPRWVVVSILCLWGWSLLNIYARTGTFASTSVMDRTCFAIIATCAARLFQSRPDAWTRIRWAAVFASSVAGAYGLWQYVGYFIANSEDQNLFISTYQNINIGAQFSGLAFISGLSLLFERQKQTSHSSRKLDVLLISGIGLSLAYIVATFCRSVFIAAPVAASVYLFLLPERKQVVQFFSKRLLKRVSIAIAFGLFSLATVQFILAKNTSSALTDLKNQVLWAKSQLLLQDGSASNRMELSRETLSLIRDNPLGVGTDQFVFEFPLYQSQGNERLTESVVYRSPHNEYLRIVSEEGIPAALLLLVVALYFLRRHFRSRPETTDAAATFRFAAITAMLTFIAIEMLLQFPMDIPMTFMFFAFTLGSSLSTARFHGIEIRRPQFRLLPATACLVALALSCAYIFRYASATHIMQEDVLDPVAARESCENLPSYWPNCVFHVTDLANNNKTRVANMISQRWLERQPGAFPFLKIWGVTQLQSNQPQPGCMALYVYETLMTSNDVSTTPIFDIKCQPFLSRDSLAKMNLTANYRTYGLQAFGIKPLDLEKIRQAKNKDKVSLETPATKARF